MKEILMYQLYGIPNCDSVKKAKKHLESQGIEFEFIDFKKSGPTLSLIKKWQDYLGEIPVNKRGTTFRKIKEEFEGSSVAEQRKLLTMHSSAIKRPILHKGDKTIAIGLPEVSAL